MDIIKNLKSRFDSVQCDFLIAIAAIALVILPFILNHRNKKTGKPSCSMPS